MIETYDFIRSVLDTIVDHVVVINNKGHILFVNEAWRSFGKDNACLIGRSWDQVNYLEECDKAAAMGDDFGITAADGIRAVINGDEKKFFFEYPCHSPNEKRWFMMRVASFVLQGNQYYVISHQNITERKLAEEEVLNLSRIDGLTGIANRRFFNEFLENEWKRCLRLGLPIALAIIDLDYFKLLNDTYGHQAGDECLRQVGKVLKTFSRRPGDLCARYGGEEFAIIYAGVDQEQIRDIVITMLEEIRTLRIPNERSPICPVLTASVGLASIKPDKNNCMNELLETADKLLYLAKTKGRNQICLS